MLRSRFRRNATCRTLAFALLWSLIGCAAKPVAPAAAPQPRQAALLRVAVTVDDLPGSRAYPGWPKSRIVETIVRALLAHRVPVPVGFVNGIYGEDPDAQQALRSWLEAGLPVGNHSYSHLSANAQDAAAFGADVARNRAWLAQRASPAQHSSYFRYPFLERGASAEQRAAIRRSLHEQGYRIVNTSLDFADWAFVDAYMRCLARADEFALTRLTSAYLENARAALFWSAETAERVFNRAIPQVLLLHAGAPTAINIGALLTEYEQQGVTWISIEEALTDPAFAEEVERDQGNAGTISEQVQRARLPVHSFVPRSLSLLELACR